MLKNRVINLQRYYYRFTHLNAILGPTFENLKCPISVE